MMVTVAKIEDIAPDGLKSVKVNGKEITLCNYNKKIYAVERRCSHANAPLELGSLDGNILTCPMHHAQFDIITGEMLSGPVPGALIGGMNKQALMNYHSSLASLPNRTGENLKTYKVLVEGNDIKVDISK